MKRLCFQYAHQPVIADFVHGRRFAAVPFDRRIKCYGGNGFHVQMQFKCDMASVRDVGNRRIVKSERCRCRNHLAQNCPRNLRPDNVISHVFGFRQRNQISLRQLAVQNLQAVVQIQSQLIGFVKHQSRADVGINFVIFANRQTLAGVNGNFTGAENQTGRK